MGRFTAVLACIVIISLDILAGILSFRAEAAQNQKKHVRLWILECEEPSHEAFVLAIAAATLLGIAHVIANLMGGCTQQKLAEPSQASPCRQIISMACLVFTWIVLGIGLSMLAMGIISNHKSRSSCGFTYGHFLSIGGMMCIVHAVFAVAYYLTSTYSIR